MRSTSTHGQALTGANLTRPGYPNVGMWGCRRSFCSFRWRNTAGQGPSCRDPGPWDGRRVRSRGGRGSRGDRVGALPGRARRAAARAAAARSPPGVRASSPCCSTGSSARSSAVLFFGTRVLVGQGWTSWTTLLHLLRRDHRARGLRGRQRRPADLPARRGPPRQHPRRPRAVRRCGPRWSAWCCPRWSSAPTGAACTTSPPAPPSSTAAEPRTRPVPAGTLEPWQGRRGSSTTSSRSPTSAQLRAWFAEHHDSAAGVWLVTWKRSADPERHVPYDDVVRECLLLRLDRQPGPGRGRRAERDPAHPTPAGQRLGADEQAAGGRADRGRARCCRAGRPWSTRPGRAARGRCSTTSRTWSSRTTWRQRSTRSRRRGGSGTGSRARPGGRRSSGSCGAKRPATREKRVAEIVEPGGPRGCASGAAPTPARTPPQVTAERGTSERGVVVPGPGGQDVGQRLDGVVDVDVAQVERRQPEAQAVRLAVVADDAAGDQRLHDRVRLGVRERQVAAAPVVLAGRDQGDRLVAAALLDEVEEEVAERERLGPDGVEVGAGRDVEAALDEGERDDRLGAAEEAHDARRRLVGVLHRERSGVAPPAGQRLAAGLGVPRVDPEEGRARRGRR